MDKGRKWSAKVRWIADGSQLILPLLFATVEWDIEKKCLVLRIRNGRVVTFPKNCLFLPPKMPHYSTLLLNAQQSSTRKNSNIEITMQFLDHETLVNAYEYLKNFLNVGLPQQSGSHKLRSGSVQRRATPLQQCRSELVTTRRSEKTISGESKTNVSLFNAAVGSLDSKKSSDGQRLSLTSATEDKQLRLESRQPVHTSDSFYGSHSENMRPKTLSSSERTPVPPKRRRTLMSVLTDMDKTESANKINGEVMRTEEAVLPSRRRLSPPPRHNLMSSSKHRGSTFRRRISDVHETLVCTTSQSPAKSPIKRPQLVSPLSDSSERLNRGGFANLGSTCYMNAVLQAMFSVEPFSKELFKLWQHCNERFEKCGISIQGIELLSALSTLACRRYVASSEQNRNLLKGVMEAIKNDTFSGNRQEDAQEFMAHVFDQVSDECSKVISERLGNEQSVNDEVKVPNNPVTSNFMFKIQNYIVCESCGHTYKTSEESTSLPIDFIITNSRYEDSAREKLVSIQTMLDDCLRNEKVEHRCDSCDSNSAEIMHKFQKIPRCLVMYLKRYTFEGAKRADNVAIPLFVTLDGHCTDTMESYERVPLSTTKIDLLSVNNAMQSNGPFTPQKSQYSDSEKMISMTPPPDENDSQIRTNLCIPSNVQNSEPTYNSNFEPSLRNHHRKSSNVPRRLWSSSNTTDAPITSSPGVCDMESLQLPQIILPPSDESKNLEATVNNFTSPISSTKKSVQKSALLSPSSHPEIVPSGERQHFNSCNIDANKRHSSPYATPKHVRKGPFTAKELAQMTEIEQMKAALEMSIRAADSTDDSVIEDCEQMDKHRGLRSVKSTAVTNVWRAKACRFLEIEMADELVYPEQSREIEMSFRDPPARCGTVVGDGNCLFRALAFAITGGSDEQHTAIRECIASFELAHTDRFRVLVEEDEKTWEEHLDALISNGSWGGSSELTAIATMLQIEVWTFLDGRWVCYSPRFQKSAGRGELVDIPLNEYQIGSRPAIYLLNEHYHYSPVIELSNKRFLAERALERRLKINANSGELEPSYRLVSVVSHYGSSSYSGHYVCDVWSQKQSQWLHYDDSSVSEISEKDVRDGRATTGYLFFYMAKDVLDEEEV